MKHIDAVKVLRQYIDKSPHGDNCFLRDEGEYNSCFCGKEAILAATENIEQAEPVGFIQWALDEEEKDGLQRDTWEAKEAWDACSKLYATTQPAPQPAKPDALVPEWISVDDRLPEERSAPYRIAAICKKEVDIAGAFLGEGMMRMGQDWNVRRWPHNYTHWMEIPPPPSTETP